MKRSSLAIVGAGRLGSALAVQLQAAGYRISEIVCRSERASKRRAQLLARRVGADAVTADKARMSANIIWFCLPDAQIAAAALHFAGRSWSGKIALHSSGVLASDALGALRKRGASVGSAHPLMTFVAGSSPDLTGVPFAIEGDRVAAQAAARIARELGGKPFPIGAQEKPAYHAFATMICPLLVALLAASEEAAGLAGMSAGDTRRRMAPILRQTIANYERLGSAQAFTGPFVRGDIETIRLHLDVLSQVPEALDAYRSLGKAALKFLPHRNAAKIRAMLRDR
ncbi:MAG TPA: Rossmann-like and DUF2520 domain-containing protein [Terriglobales bacterium]